MATQKYTRFQDIPPFTKDSPYVVDVSFDYLEQWINHQAESAVGYKMDICPDFQRGHVWTKDQQVAFVEFKLKGGRSGSDIFWNHPGWMGNWKGTLELVDGLQRLTAVRRFLNDEIPVFGDCYHRGFTDRLRLSGSGSGFKMHVNNLRTRAQVLQWYLEMNSGGTPHTQAELDRVAALLNEEKSRG